MNNNARSLLTRWLIRLGLLGAWALVILVFMYVPVVWSFFLPKHNVLYVYGFTDSISPEAAAAFYEKTGVQVRLSYFQSNDELLAKLSLTEGAGYDVIIASDYMIAMLRERNILGQINHEQLSHYASIDKRLLGRYYDPQNQFSVPLHWTVYGIGYEKKFFPAGLPRTNWGLVFEDPQIIAARPWQVTVPDDRREMVFLASLYLTGTGQNTGFSPQARAQIEKLLIAQKQWVGTYTSDRPEYELATGIVPVVISPASYLKKIMIQSDEFGFFLPKEGSLLVVDNLAIPRLSTRVQLAHSFIDFILSKEVAAASSRRYGVNPSNAAAYEAIPQEFREDSAFFPDDEQFKKLGLLRPEQKPGELEQMWLAVKTA